MLKLLLFLILSSVFNLSASESVAIVLKVRGDATFLLPGAHDAKKLKVGDKLLLDTSILTSDKSFVQIKFIDETILNLGASSKVVINELGVGTPGILSLLKGRIRAEVTKSKVKNENKFFIKTRSAALGIRGTEFQTIYNPDNNLTSLLTFKGEVKIIKIDESEFNKIESLQNDIKVNSDDNSKIDITKSPDSSKKIARRLNYLLSSDSAVTVLEGQNSVALIGKKEATPPVTINATQFRILNKNKEFNSKNALNFKAAKPLAEESMHGGFVDSNTGFYIDSPPNGEVDRDTGEFIIPKGIILDSKKGFIVEGETEDPVLYALRDDLNKSIASDISIKNGNKKFDSELSEQYVHDEFIFSFTPFLNSDLDINNSQYKIKSGKTNFKTSLEWRISAKNQFRPLLGFGLTNSNLNDNLPSDLSMGSRKLYSMYTGLMYAYNKNIEFYTSLGIFEDYYLNYTSTTGTKALKKVATIQTKIGVLSTMFQEQLLPIHTDLFLTYQLSKNINTLQISNAIGLNMFLGSSYKFKSNNLLKFGIWLDNRSIDVISDSLSYKHKKMDRGLVLNYIIK